MIKGVGIDLTSISEVATCLGILGKGTLARIFTNKELAGSRCALNTAEYLASRFAAKEAVFKAIAHLHPEAQFDMRTVETLNRNDGSPYVNVDNHLSDILRRTGVDCIHISITTEGDFAAAMVVAE